MAHFFNNWMLKTLKGNIGPLKIIKLYTFEMMNNINLKNL